MNELLTKIKSDNGHTFIGEFRLKDTREACSTILSKNMAKQQKEQDENKRREFDAGVLMVAEQIEMLRKNREEDYQEIMKKMKVLKA